MFFRLFLLFTIIPLVELYILIRIGQVIGAWNTLLLVLLTGVSGAYLARREGIRTFQRIQDLLAHGEMPGEALVDALLILIAGFLLITPGVLTDVLGLFFLFPPTRGKVREALRKYFEKKLSSGNVTITYKGPF